MSHDEGMMRWWYGERGVDKERECSVKEEQMVGIYDQRRDRDEDKKFSGTQYYMYTFVRSMF